jgi:NAD/NADP transhydrogenase alpha subunit
MYARNLLNFLNIMLGKDASFTINAEDDLIKATLP